MKKSIRETVKDAIESAVAELGYRIWDITYSKIGADYHLEITIDNDEGIYIEDCEKVHRAIEPIIDECDPIEGFYYLEVSSPGIERELRTDEHISASVGKKVLCKLFAAKEGQKSFEGVLLGYENSVISLDVLGSKIELERSEVSKINTVYFE